MNNYELENKTKASVYELIKEKGYVSPVDLFMKLGFLTLIDYEKWRNCKVDYLERACKVNLTKLSLINKTMKAFAEECGCKPSKTVYKSWGKSAKRTLRFSKSGSLKIEEAYSTHYVKPKNIDTQ